MLNSDVICVQDSVAPPQNNGTSVSKGALVSFKHTHTHTQAHTVRSYLFITSPMTAYVAADQIITSQG